MQRVTRPNAIGVLPAYPVSPGPPGFFTPGNPLGGIMPTVPGAEWYNGVQEELIAVISAAGLTPDGTNNGQVLAAIRAICGPGRLLNMQIFTSSGTYTPSLGTGSVLVEVQGAGGAGSGVPATSGSQTAIGSGGGSGAYAMKRLFSGFAGVTVTVGAGGSSPVSGTGNNGGASSFGGLVSALGGAGGVFGISSASTYVAAPGAGGASGISGDLNLPGTPGGFGLTANSVGVVPAQALSPRFGAGAGAGGQGASSAFGEAAKAGTAGNNGIVIVWEYAG